MSAGAAVPRPFKVPQSVLVVIHTPALEVLLIERADVPGFWQSVTGAKDDEQETFEATAVREVMEETGIDAHAPHHRLSDWGLETSTKFTRIGATVTRLPSVTTPSTCLVCVCPPPPWCA